MESLQQRVSRVSSIHVSNIKYDQLLVNAPNVGKIRGSYSCNRELDYIIVNK